MSFMHARYWLAFSASLHLLHLTTTVRSGKPAPLSFVGEQLPLRSASPEPVPSIVSNVFLEPRTLFDKQDLSQASTPTIEASLPEYGSALNAGVSAYSHFQAGQHIHQGHTGTNPIGDLVNGYKFTTDARNNEKPLEFPAKNSNIPTALFRNPPQRSGTPQAESRRVAPEQRETNEIPRHLIDLNFPPTSLSSPRRATSASALPSLANPGTIQELHTTTILVSERGELMGAGQRSICQGDNCPGALRRKEPSAHVETISAPPSNVPPLSATGTTLDRNQGKKVAQGRRKRKKLSNTPLPTFGRAKKPRPLGYKKSEFSAFGEMMKEALKTLSVEYRDEIKKIDSIPFDGEILTFYSFCKNAFTTKQNKKKAEYERRALVPFAFRWWSVKELRVAEVEAEVAKFVEDLAARISSDWDSRFVLFLSWLKPLAARLLMLCRLTTLPLRETAAHYHGGTLNSHIIEEEHKLWKQLEEAVKFCTEQFQGQHADAKESTNVSELGRELAANIAKINPSTSKLNKFLECHTWHLYLKYKLREAYNEKDNLDPYKIFYNELLVYISSLVPLETWEGELLTRVQRYIYAQIVLGDPSNV